MCGMGDRLRYGDSMLFLCCVALREIEQLDVCGFDACTMLCVCMVVWEISSYLILRYEDSIMLVLILLYSVLCCVYGV